MKRNPWFAAARSVVYGAAFLGAWAWLALQVRALDPWLGLALPAWSRAAGWTLMVLGGLVALACAASLILLGEGTPAPFDPPREFVTTGIYRWVRNPMYIGGTLILAGLGLWHRSAAMTLFAGLFLLAAHLFVRFVEEPGLEERFGDEYRRYRERVNRWLPTAPG